MDPIFQRLWERSRPYYEKARPMDIEHIQWMMPEAQKVCDMEHLDVYLLMPLVILHDIGYSNITSINPFQNNERIEHMREGANLAEKILIQMQYPIDKHEQVVHYIAIHDVWAINNHQVYQHDIVLGCFNDLDFIWMTTEKGFIYVAEYLKLNPQEMFDFIQHNEKIINRPFNTKTTQNLYDFHLKQRARDLQIDFPR